MEIFAISALVNALVALGFGIFVVSYNTKGKINWLYFLLGLSVAVWSFGYWRWQMSVTAESALFWVRILTMGSTLIPVFYFHWVMVLVEKDKEQKRVINSAYLLAILILLFSFSPLLVESVSPKMFFPFWPNPGLVYHLYLAVVYCGLVTYSLYLLSKEYKKAEKERRIQIIYVLLGSVFGFGGGIFNFFLWYDIPIPPYGNFLIVLYPLFWGYAVIKHRLSNVKIVSTEILVFILWIFVFIRALLSQGSRDLFINSVIMVAVGLVGIFLIRGILRDVKQREQIEKLAADISRAYEVEKRANDELKELDRVKNQFLAQTQHDLRTPLTSIRGYCDLLVQGAYGKQAPKTVEVIKKIELVAEEKIRDVNNFLDVTQFRLGKGVVNVKPGIDLAAIIKEITDLLKLKCEQKKIYLKFKKPKNNILITADREKLKGAIFNIIDNAIKYTPKGGVTVEIKSDKNILIEVRDTGIGIPADKIGSLFYQTFERTAQAQKTASGSGVGLYLSAQIVKLHKGRVWAESAGENKGSAFFIQLPVV